MDRTKTMNISRRKSMRYAADCLGFSVPPPSSIPAPDVPPIEVLTSDDSHLPEDSVPIVSVDTFLRRTTLPRTKTYSKKSRRKDRAKQLNDTTNLDDMSPEAQIGVPAKPIHRPSKSLKKRLLRAAVLSNADELLLDGSIPQARQPLSFVEQRPSPREPVHKKRRTWSLVDPRKAVPARPNSFSSRDKAPSPSKINTLSGWRATYGRIYLDGAMISKRKPRASKIAPQGPLKCLPLSFVPLHEAEKRYSLMRLPHKYGSYVYLFADL
ncbi:hypothetical protein B0H14DRAFT_3851281 [Mycena olivaceomarginata]|nr:hypothetical protein B0H14DRAFT_3851281 [Mycena olivaceomarginata]